MVRSRAQKEMIRVINSLDHTWPITLLYLTENGADMKLQTGNASNRKEEQLTMAALYLMFLEENICDGDLRAVADEVAETAETLRDDEFTGEFHTEG